MFSASRSLVSSLTSILQELLLRKNLFDNLAAQRQPRRFALEPFIFLDQRLMFCLKPPQVIGFLGGEPLKHQPAAAVFRLPRGIRVKRVAAPFNRQRQFQRIADHRRFEALLVRSVPRLFAVFARMFYTSRKPHSGCIAPQNSFSCGYALDQIFNSCGTETRRSGRKSYK